MISFVLLVLLGILLYIKMVKTYDYWTKKGIKQRKQVYLLGDDASVIFRKETFFDMIITAYNAFPEERYMGMYHLITPFFVIRDPELIKQICVKEFEHFVNHQDLYPEDSDPIWSKNLACLKGNHWREIRATMNPNFTSSKMRVIFNLLSECADEYAQYFKKTRGTKSVELQDIFHRYANDIIATVAFGIKCDSINDKTNEFYLMGKKVITYSFWRNLSFFVISLMPKLSSSIGLKFLPQKVTNFFKNVVANAIKAREEQGINRPDLINLLLEASKDNKCEITHVDIAAQGLIFFFSGFETVSDAMSLMGYELTTHPDIQKRLQREIDKTIKSCNGILTYEALMEMKYMDMVVLETLRKWPTSIFIDRVCTRHFTIDAINPNEKPFTLEPGEILFIPINAIHRDPNYHPNPEEFDPERFNDEKKDTIKPYTYFPFGVGPRNCIGSRFALMEMKTIFFHLLLNFDFVVVEKTDIPLRLSMAEFNLMAHDGIWVGLKQRKVKQ